MKKADFYHIKDDVIVCDLCPHRCNLKDGQIGKCRVRKAIGNQLFSLSYGKAVSIHIDPMEKKPLYHFMPGTEILSTGTSGCNLRCDFCQNYTISQSLIDGSVIEPGMIAEASKKHGTVGVAYTYTEPTIWYEFITDTAPLVHAEGLKNVLVTNGFIEKEPLDRLLPFIDAMNIDLKSMDKEFYSKYCGASLEPVLGTIEQVYGKTHIEITCLVITDLNDSEDNIRRLSEFIAGIDHRIPLHLSRYHPSFKRSSPPTPVIHLERALDIAREHLSYVYVGNAQTRNGSNTFCPACSNLLIRRTNYSTYIDGLIAGKCNKCGRLFDGVM